MEGKNINNMKNQVNCYLELYVEQLNILKEKAFNLYCELFSKPEDYWRKNKHEFTDLYNNIQKLNYEKKALQECKNDCISSL